MKRLTISLLGAFAFAAVAQAADPAQDNASQDPTVREATAPATLDEAKQARLDDRNCVRYTGSRIQPRADQKDPPCVIGPGRSHTREDLERTGRVDLADALRTIDPSIY